MATRAYLDIDQGSDFTAELTLEDATGAINLNGYSVYSQFRKSYSSTVGYSFVCNVVDAANGVISLSLSGVTSSAIKPGRYLYDVEIISGTGQKIRVIEGIITLNAEITKIP